MASDISNRAILGLGPHPSPAATTAPPTRAELEKRGHLLTVEGLWALGRVCAVGRWGGFLRAAATPRLMQAYAAGR